MNENAKTVTVEASTASTQLLALNHNRVGGMIYNNSSSVMYLLLGLKSSSTAFTRKLAQDDYYELPFDYTGHVTGCWVTATGNALITEIIQ